MVWLHLYGCILRKEPAFEVGKATLKAQCALIVSRGILFNVLQGTIREFDCARTQNCYLPFKHRNAQTYYIT